MSTGDDEVVKLFEQIFQARRAVAARAADMRDAELTLETRREELARAKQRLEDLDARMQDMVDRAAGVSRHVPDDEVRAPNLFAGYRPIQRS